MLLLSTRIRFRLGNKRRSEVPFWCSGAHNRNMEEEKTTGSKRSKRPFFEGGPPSSVSLTVSYSNHVPAGRFFARRSRRRGSSANSSGRREIAIATAGRRLYLLDSHDDGRRILAAFFSARENRRLRVQKVVVTLQLCFFSQEGEARDVVRLSS